MTIVRYFRDLRINNKLSLLLLSIFAGFACLGGAYWVMLKNQQASDQRTSEFIQFGQDVGTAQQSYYKVRRYEKNFILGVSASMGRTYNEEPLKQHKEQLTVLQRQIKALQTQSSMVDQAAQQSTLEEDIPSNYMQALVTQALEVIRNYQRSFDDVVRFNKVIGLGENKGLRGELNRVIEQLRIQIAETGSIRMTTLLASMEVGMQQILQSVDLTQDYEQFKTDHAAFVSEIQQARNVNSKEKQGLLELADKYSAAAGQIITNKRKANEYNELYDFILGPIFDELARGSKQYLTANQKQEAANTIAISRIMAVALLTIFIVISALLYLFGRGFIKPILAIRSTIHKVNEGDTEARTHMRRKDEIGQLSGAFDQLLDERVAQLANSERENEKLNNSIIDLLRSVAKLSQKDFTVQVPVSEDVTGAVGDSLNLLSSETATALNGVRRISNDVSHTAGQIRNHSAALLRVAESARAQVENTSKQLQYTSRSMTNISSEAQQVNEKAGSALNNTQTALGTVNQTIQGINAIRDTISETEKRIKRLGERSQEITGVVNLINSIAERTHILALNASMHAASAGEAGRGFAVVADEVQRLAENAREATTEIGTLVANIKLETADTVTAMNNAITQVAQGTQLAEQAGLAMKNTQSSTEDLVRSVEHIAKSSKEQARATNLLLKRAEEIVAGTRQTDKFLKVQNLATERLNEYSSQLVNTVSVFKLPESLHKPAPVSIPELEQEVDKFEGSSEHVLLNASAQ